MARGVEHLVNQQVLRWLEEQKKSTPDRVPPSRVREQQQPMITISREFGALGGEVGRRVAERLSIGFHSQEIVHEVAKRQDVRRQVVESLDERIQSRLETWIDDLMVLRRFTQSDYLHGLSETVLALARSRSGVIVGRGGHLILEPRRTLRVRTYAPLEFRVQFIADRDGMSLEEARKKILRVDEERRTFFERHFQSDITSPHQFDLLLNTAEMSLDECALVVSELFKKRFDEPG